jgi:septin family protein
VEYSDEFITIIDSMGFEPNINEELFIHMTKALIQDRQKRENIQEHIHLVWYCIAAVNARVTSTDIKLIEEISKYCKLQIVITKSEGAIQNVARRHFS